MSPSPHVDAILRDALEGCDELALVERLCERLNADGVPLMRAAVGCGFLDPSFDSHMVRWARGERSVREMFFRDPTPEGTEAWKISPFRTLVAGTDARLRRRLGDGYQPGEFPVLDTFRARGATDYMALVERVGPSIWVGESRGVITSWLSDGPAGFDDASIELLAAIMPALSATFLGRTQHSTTRTLLATYLGQHAAERVLAGNVIRGRAEPMRAVVWFADLVGFTRVADTSPGDVVLAMLNDYAEAQVEAIEGQGGHVLKFIGDGLLAIFPGANESSACLRALDAAVDFRLRVASVSERRAADGLPVTYAHIALHIGEVLYGNVGSARRLDFTVLGAAVNEAARIEALCGSLDQPIIVSNVFAQAAGDARSRLVSLGRYALKGVAKPQELFTLDR
ncbi:MAG: adenylate/guanylate cyclase domain-containing protein [Betaproteobacteria bacterium]